MEKNDPNQNPVKARDYSYTPDSAHYQRRMVEWKEARVIESIVKKYLSVLKFDFDRNI